MIRGGEGHRGWVKYRSICLVGEVELLTGAVTQLHGRNPRITWTRASVDATAPRACLPRQWWGQYWQSSLQHLPESLPLYTPTARTVAAWQPVRALSPSAHGVLGLRVGMGLHASPRPNTLAYELVLVLKYSLSYFPLPPRPCSRLSSPPGADPCFLSAAPALPFCRACEPSTAAS